MGHLIIGRILRPWGVKGQLKVEPMTDDIYRFKDLKSVLLSSKDQKLSKQVASVIFLKSEFVVIQLVGIDTKDDAQRLQGLFLEIPRSAAIKLQEGRFFISEVLGMNVIDENDQLLGTVSDIFTTKAHDVYVIKKISGSEFLIPAVKEFILDIDICEKIVTIKSWEGMME